MQLSCYLARTSNTQRWCENYFILLPIYKYTALTAVKAMCKFCCRISGRVVNTPALNEGHQYIALIRHNKFMLLNTSKYITFPLLITFLTQFTHVSQSKPFSVQPLCAIFLRTCLSASACLSICPPIHHCQGPEIIYSGYLGFKSANILWQCSK